jgi:hypothetical protein
LRQAALGTIRHRRLTRLAIVALLGGLLPVWTARAGADERPSHSSWWLESSTPGRRRSADAPFQLHVTNSSAAAIEFEARLHRGACCNLGDHNGLLPALRPGTYPFFDDFHNETPRGSIVGK